MAQFDELVAKYRNLTYGRLAGTNPSAVNSLLNAQDRGTNSITSPNYFGNIPIEQQQYIDTPSGFIGQNQFRIDPNTGIPVFETPTTEAINQGIEMGGGTVGSGAYDQNVDYGDEGYAGVTPVDPDTGLVGTTTKEREGGGGRDGFRFGKPIESPSYNPNLLGAYIGYNNPNYDPSPYGEDANVFGDALAALNRRRIAAIAKIKEVASGGYSAPEGTTGTGGTIGSVPQGPFANTTTTTTTAAADGSNASTTSGTTTPGGAVGSVPQGPFGNAGGSGGGGGGGSGASTGNEGSGSGAVGSTGPTGRSRGSW